MEDPKPDKDMRPRYKKIEKVLVQVGMTHVCGMCDSMTHMDD
jgi:hypothetical protein